MVITISKLTLILIGNIIYVIGVMGLSAFVHWDIEAASMATWDIGSRVFFIVFYFPYIAIVLFYLQPRWIRDGYPISKAPSNTSAGYQPDKKDPAFSTEQLMGIFLQILAGQYEKLFIIFNEKSISFKNIRDINELRSLIKSRLDKHGDTMQVNDYELLSACFGVLLASPEVTLPTDCIFRSVQDYQSALLAQISYHSKIINPPSKVK